MRRRSFLLAAGAAAVSSRWKGAAQTSLGTLAWVESGGLWIREMPDGRAVKLASTDGLHAPRLSSSGRWLSYQNRDDKLFVVRNDGTSGASIDAERGVWFPREDRLGFLTDDGLSVFGPENGRKSPVLLPKAGSLPVFAPDGEQFVFERDFDRVPPKEDFPPPEQLCLGSLAAPNRKPEVLVSNEDGSLQTYAWTRNGKSVLYWGADEYSASVWSDGVPLYSVAVEGAQARKLNVSTLVHDDILDVAPQDAGNRLVVTSGDGRETWSDKRIAVIDLETGGSQNLTPEEVAANCPAWSPDGRQIAYVAAPDADAAYMKAMAGVNIRVMGPDGTVETKLVTPKMRLGPGGEEAHVFLQQRKIWVLDPGGAGKPRALTADARFRDEEPLWSAGGSHILFGRMDYDGHASLWLTESSGGPAKQVCKLQIFDPLTGDGNWFGYYGYIDWRDAFDWRRA